MNQESRNTGKRGKISECAEARKNLRKSAKICGSLSYFLVFLIDLYARADDRSGRADEALRHFHGG